VAVLEHAAGAASRFTARPKFLRRSVGFELLLGIAVVSATTIIPLAQGSIYWGQVFLLADVYLIAAVSLNILRGEAGQISFGQGAIFGAAAYATGMAAGEYGVPIWPAMGLGVASALVFGLLLALPALRVQGFYLAFVTLAAAVVFPELLTAYNDFTHAITGVSVPVDGVGESLFWGMDWIAVTILCFTIAMLLVHALIRSSRFGRQMRIAAASPEAALSLGISPGSMRIAAFAISAIGTGVAGALYVPLFGFVSPGAFPLSLSILLYFAVVVGGESTLVGPIAGLYLLYILPNNVLTGLLEYRLLVYGGIAFGVMLFFPDGLIGSVREWVRRWRGQPIESLISIDSLVESGHESGGERDELAPPILRISGATKSFGAVRALDGVSLGVAPGEIHGLVGPNGSGKTTLLNALSGFVRLESGEVVVDDVPLARRSPRSRARLGVGRTFQTPRVFEGLSVWENVDLSRPKGDRADQISADVLREVRPRWDAVPAAALPHAQRRLLEVVRVLRSSPRILLLDEPAAGLSAEERAMFAEALTFLAHDVGLAIVLVEHDLGLVWQIADRITVMDEGRLLCSGSPAELEGNSALESVLVGGGRRADAD
jgi:branched-chain amino acid transport system permease protein